MKAEVPADVIIIRTLAGGAQQLICSCWTHAGYTTQHLQAQCGPGDTITTRKADPQVHGCKGHLEDWSVS